MQRTITAFLQQLDRWLIVGASASEERAEACLLHKTMDATIQTAPMTKLLVVMMRRV